jgi:hypothetical protein
MVLMIAVVVLVGLGGCSFDGRDNWPRTEYLCADGSFSTRCPSIHATNIELEGAARRAGLSR